MVAPLGGTHCMRSTLVLTLVHFTCSYRYGALCPLWPTRAYLSENSLIQVPHPKLANWQRSTSAYTSIVRLTLYSVVQVLFILETILPCEAPKTAQKREAFRQVLSRLQAGFEHH